MPSPEVLVLGIPYEGKENFLPGAKEAPERIRWALESIEIKSFYQNALMPEYRDLGDLKVEAGTPLDVLTRIKEKLMDNLDLEKRFLFLGGDHTITWATVGAYLAVYSDLYVIHLDAHLDRRNTFEGERLNHATVIKRIEEMIGPQRVFSLGIRSIAPEEEAQFAKAKDLAWMTEKFKGKPFYLTLDVDVLDPSEFPAVSNPEPGGISFKELLDSLLPLGGKLVGADIVEVNPRSCNCHYPLVTAAVLVRELLILLSK